MQRILMILALAVGAVSALTAEGILDAVDANLVYKTLTAEAKMVVVTPEGETRTKLLTMVAKGSDKALVTVTYPAREEGTRQLRLGDEMWLYIPAEDKELKLTGNMLQRSMLGSDFSYEDMMTRTEYRDDYTAELTGTEELRGRQCYVLDLAARYSDVTYRRRKLWVDQELFVPLRQELYGASGSLLKVMTMSGIAQYGSRWYPTVVTMQDVVRGSGKTTITSSDLVFDRTIPDDTFSKSHLRD